MLPKHAFSTDKLFVAWARSVNQEEFYLAVWKNEDSWRAASQGQGQVNHVSPEEFEYQVHKVLKGGPQVIAEHDRYQERENE